MNLRKLIATSLFFLTTMASTNYVLATNNNVPLDPPTPLACEGTIAWANPEIGSLATGSGAEYRLINGRKNVINTDTTIPAGTYTAVARSWDGYVNRHKTVQTNEQYHVVLTASGSEVYRSAATNDPADPTDRDSAQIDTNLGEFTIDQDAVLSFVHVGGNGPGSVIPTGVCFQRVVDECEYDSNLTAEDPNCKPKCEHNSAIFADDPNCQPECEYNQNLLANDVNCRPECEHNSALYQGDENCKPACEHDVTKFADDPNCKEVCEHDSTKYADDEDCEPKITVVQNTPPKVTQLPRTGAGSVAFLAAAVTTSAGAAHAAIRSRLSK